MHIAGPTSEAWHEISVDLGALSATILWQGQRVDEREANAAALNLDPAYQPALDHRRFNLQPRPGEGAPVPEGTQPRQADRQPSGASEDRPPEYPEAPRPSPVAQSTTQPLQPKPRPKARPRQGPPPKVSVMHEPGAMQMTGMKPTRGAPLGSVQASRCRTSRPRRGEAQRRQCEEPLAREARDRTPRAQRDAKAQNGGRKHQASLAQEPLGGSHKTGQK